MPRYATAPEQYEGAVFPPVWPLRVLDAAGRELPDRIVYFDTDTGIVVAHPEDPLTGSSKLDDSGRFYVKEITLHPAPLVIVPYDPARQTDTPTVVGG